MAINRTYLFATHSALTIKHRRLLFGPMAEGYESRALPSDYKEDHDNRRNQVYSASPVKTVDKANESEMYEISPYATFSVNGGRTGAGASQSKTPTRGGSGGSSGGPCSLDYTMQFKTFGHPEGENLNATAFPLLPSSGFGHVKSKSSWHKQRYYNTDTGSPIKTQHRGKLIKSVCFPADESTLSKSMTLVAGSQSGHSKKSSRSGSGSGGVINAGGGSGNSKKNCASAGKSSAHCESESDTSISPSTEFSNMPTYRVPCKSSRNGDNRGGMGDIFRPDSSTESNNDQTSPIERRLNTPRHASSGLMVSGVKGDKRAHRSRKHQQLMNAGKDNHSLDRRRCNNR